MQVIHELRNGVKLRKVSESAYVLSRHIEYELTPFEILLDQIRAKKYHLRKVALSHFCFYKKIFFYFWLILTVEQLDHTRNEKGGARHNPRIYTIETAA